MVLQAQSELQLSSTAKYETKRHAYKWRRIGEIERDFKGAREWWRTHPLLKHSPQAWPFFDQLPTCLDDILAGRSVNMVTLQELFRMNRNRFPSKLPSLKDGRKRLYDYRAVVKIMDVLLTEPVKHKRSAKGRSRALWLSNADDPDLQARVLQGIKIRINALSVPEQIKPKIKREFLAVVRRHLPDSAKK